MPHRTTTHRRPRRARAVVAIVAALASVGVVSAPPAAHAQTVAVVVIGPTAPVQEGGRATFVIGAIPNGTTPITARFRTSNTLNPLGSNPIAATPGVDYVQVVGQNVTLSAANNWSATVDVTVLDDASVEGPEIIVGEIDNVTNGTEAVGTAAATIAASDLPGVPSIPSVPIPQVGVPKVPSLGPLNLPPISRFSVADTSINEGTGGTTSATFTIAREGTLLPASIRYETADGSALAGGDYTEASGSLWFNSGVKSRTVTVEVISDSVVEGDEAFTLLLDQPLLGSIQRGEGIATIIDDDAPPPPAGVARKNVTPGGAGYWLHDSVGNVASSGDALRFGGIFDHIAPHRLRMVALASDQTATGAWAVDHRGGVYSLGSARFHGSMPGLVNAGHVRTLPVVADIAAPPAGDGYTVLSRDGGVFTFGKASFHGSLHSLVASGALKSAPEAVALAYTPSGRGYWILTTEGGVFSFGDARFHGSMPGLLAQGRVSHLPRMASIAPTPGGNGYALMDHSGGVFTFGDASFHGSVPGLVAERRIAHAVSVRDLEYSPSGRGYWVFGWAGGVYAFGDAPFHGAAQLAG